MPGLALPMLALRCYASPTRSHVGSGHESSYTYIGSKHCVMFDTSVSHECTSPCSSIPYVLFFVVKTEGVDENYIVATNKAIILRPFTGVLFRNQYSGSLNHNTITKITWRNKMIIISMNLSPLLCTGSVLIPDLWVANYEKRE
jgi:hypothetical protein